MSTTAPADHLSAPPAFRDGARPRAESPRRVAAVRLVAVAALAVTAAYLTWRIGAGTVNLAAWWVAVPLLVAEIHNAFGLLLYTVALWEVDGGPTPPRSAPVARPGLRVAVLIPTYNEPVEVLLPTVAASVALRPVHETWVLDDGRRDDIRLMAERLGARYLTRPDNAHAKAGNLNHALTVVEADVVAVLDADHVPTADFLLATLPYFDDPQIAFVQTPQDFYNLDSFEHQRRGDGQVFNEEAVFYRVIAPAKNRWQASFWCGTCALVRTDALRSVGGVATDSVTEDIHTTIRMFRAGWKGAYHNEVLARGLAPDDAASYLLQRNRWALGAMQVLRVENPLLGPGLAPAQRLAFMTTLFGWFDAWRTLAYMVIPLAVVATGAVPILAPGAVFAPFFVATLAIQFVALRLLARGHYPPFLSVLFEVLRMPAILPATLALLAPRRNLRFRVTPKGRQGDGRARVPVPRLHVLLAASSLVGMAWFVASLAGLTPVRYEIPWAAIGAALFMAMNLGLLIAAIGRIRSSRFAGNRRASVRLPVSLPATVDGSPVELLDLSLTGARIAAPAAVLPHADAPGEGASELRFDLHGGRFDMRVAPRRRIERADGLTELGLEFTPGQAAEIARLAVGIFQGRVAPEFVDVVPPPRRRTHRAARVAA
ncbi:MAG TPA: glycosyltransferase [Patescibacteria group bacterium]|nr:glycosyltransferase [Patescibacteria group bacterium]